MVERYFVIDKMETNGKKEIVLLSSVESVSWCCHGSLYRLTIKLPSSNVFINGNYTKEQHEIEDSQIRCFLESPEILSYFIKDRLAQFSEQEMEGEG